MSYYDKTKMTDNNIICQQLTEMGFTALEAEIYLFLITTGSQTGYAIAKGLNKPTANVYKALESLSGKGAIEYSMADKKKCTATHWQQLLKRRQKQFSQTIANLEENLTSLQLEQSNDEQVYQIEQIDHVIEESISLIDNAKQILMVEAEPASLPLLKSALEKAANRGVEIWIKVYQPVELKGMNVIVRQRGHEVYEKTQDISFKLAADGNAMLIADIALDKKKVIAAYRSRSALMAMSIYTGLLYEIVLTDLKQLIPNNKLDAAKQLLARSAHLHPMSTENSVFQHYKNKYQSKRELKK